MQLPKEKNTKWLMPNAKLSLVFAFLTLGILLATPYLSSTIFAQTDIPLAVSPVRHEVVIEPGSTENFVFKFANFSDSELAGSVKVADFIVRDSKGTPQLLEDETLPNKFSAASWITLPFDRAIIDSEEFLQVPVTISAPSDAAAGGRYVAIYFEPTGALPGISGATQEGTSGIIPRVAGLVYVRVAGPITESAQVARFEVPKFVEFGPIPTEFEILNLGNYHITPQPRLVLTNLLTNNQIDEKLVEEKNIFPEASRIFTAEIGSKWLIGRYRVDMVASYGESGQGLVATAFVWAFPWRIALLILLTLIVIALSILVISKSFRKKQHVLEEKLSEEIKEIEELKDKFKDKISDGPNSTNASSSKK